MDGLDLPSVKDLIGARERLVSAKYRPVGPNFKVTQANIGFFADATLDHNPRHVDPEKAARGMTIAHGMYPMTLIAHLSSHLNPFALFCDAQCLLAGVKNIEFGRPIRVNTEIYCLARIAEIVEHQSGIRARYKWIVKSGVGTTHCWGTYRLQYR